MKLPIPKGDEPPTPQSRKNKDHEIVSRLKKRIEWYVQVVVCVTKDIHLTSTLIEC